MAKSEEQTVRIRFLKAQEVRNARDEVVQSFKEGEEADLVESSANHWLNRNLAERVDVKKKAAATPTATETADADADVPSKTEIRKLPKDELVALAEKHGIETEADGKVRNADELREELLETLHPEE